MSEHVSVFHCAHIASYLTCFKLKLSTNSSMRNVPHAPEEKEDLFAFIRHIQYGTS